MSIKGITAVKIWVCSGIVAMALPGIPPKQTAEEIQVQKDLANQPSLPGAPEDSKTPLKMFETYFAAKTRVDASEFDYFTKRGLADYFDDQGELTEEDRKNIADGAKESGMREYKLLGFWYHTDAEKPGIVFSYTYLQNGKTEVPVTRYLQVKLELIKTEKGWRIDRLTELGGW